MDAEEAGARILAERIKGEATYHAAPPGLAARVLASLPHETAAGKPASRSRWNPWAIASAFSGAFALVLAVGVYLAVPGAEERLADEVVAGHVRSMMAGHAAGVASSDTHAVKPWFAGKLDFAPPVADLTSQGFALVGGRLDYVDRRPVAALVYRHRQHSINLFVWPAAGGARERSFERQGFHLLRWTREGMNFWAVSDLNAGDLAGFKALLGSTAE